MDFVLSKFSPNIHESIYLKNPETSELGRKILNSSVDLIEELGFEHFNFKKLGLRIQATEASVYRYFDNKHKLLLYLSSWYWGWIEYKLTFKNTNISDPVLRLTNAIDILAENRLWGQRFYVSFMVVEDALSCFIKIYLRVLRKSFIFIFKSPSPSNARIKELPTITPLQY